MVCSIRPFVSRDAETRIKWYYGTWAPFSKFTNFENGDTVRGPLTTDSGRALEATYWCQADITALQRFH